MPAEIDHCAGLDPGGDVGARALATVHIQAGVVRLRIPVPRHGEVIPHVRAVVQAVEIAVGDVALSAREPEPDVRAGIEPHLPLVGIPGVVKQRVPIVKPERLVPERDRSLVAEGIGQRRIPLASAEQAEPAVGKAVRVRHRAGHDRVIQVPAAAAVGRRAAVERPMHQRRRQRIGPRSRSRHRHSQNTHAPHRTLQARVHTTAPYDLCSHTPRIPNLTLC